MNHYTLNTGSTQLVSPYEMDKALVESLDQLVEDGGPIPGLPSFRMEVIHYGPSAAVFTIFRGWEPMITHSMAWDQQGAVPIWKAIEELYLDVSDEYSRFMPNAAAPEMPTSLPWVSVFVMPSCLVEPDLLEPLTDIGLAMAQAILEACQETS